MILAARTVLERSVCARVILRMCTSHQHAHQQWLLMRINPRPTVLTVLQLKRVGLQRCYLPLRARFC